MEARKVAAMRGWQWLVEGMALYRRSPVMWLVLALLYLVGANLLLKVPVVNLVVVLLTQVFNASFMLACRDVDQGRELELRHLFAGFRAQPAQLVTVGGFFMIGLFLVAGLAMYAGGGALLSAAAINEMHGGEPPDSAVGAIGAAAIGVLSASLLLMPLMMLVLFAPALIVFRGLGPIEAVKQSFVACLRNIPAFMVYSAVLAGVGLVLGIAFAIFGVSTENFMLALAPIYVLLFPLANNSIYASYKDIFGAGAVQAETPAASE